MSATDTTTVPATGHTDEAIARRSLARLEKLREEVQGRRGTTQARNWSRHEARALADSACIALNLRRYPEAEAAARACLALAESEDDATIEPGQLKDPVWARVLLAEALVRQGHANEALNTSEPAVAYYRQILVQGASGVGFSQHFARGLYVQALTEPSDAAGLAKRRDSLAEAAKLLNGLTDQARQLHDTKQLLSWISDAQKIANNPSR